MAKIEWTDDFELRLRKKLEGEYEQANHWIDFASRANKPIDGGLVDVESSVESMIKWLKKELGLCH
jgi:hypothetical protein